MRSVRSSAPLRHCNRAAIVLAAGAAVSLAALAPRAHAQTWVGTASGNFSDPANWTPGVPTSGTSTALTFAPSATTAVTATLDGAFPIGAPFQVNSLTFNNLGTFAISGNPTGNAFQMSGPAPTINVASIGSVNLNSSALLDLQNSITIGGSGIGSLLFLDAISGNGGITIPALPASFTTTAIGQVFHAVSLSASSTFTGGITLDGGNLVAPNGGSSSMFGPATGTLTVTNRGGVLQLPGAAGTPAVGTMQLDGRLRIIGTGTMTRAATLSGSGPIVMNGTSTLTISNNAASTYTGAVTIDRADLPQFNQNAGTITLSTANGALGTTSYNIRAGGTLNLSNATGAVNSNRIADSASINLASGLFTANTTAASLNEVVGDITGAGFSTIGMTVSSGTLPCRISANSLNRSDRGTFLIRGTNLGAAAAGNGLLTLATGPALSGGGGAAGTTNISIVPWAIGDTSGSGSGSSLLTYDTNGFRTLAAAEYVANLAGSADANVGLTASTANAAGVTMNALRLSSTGAITGAGSLKITSGTLLNSGTAGAISNGIQFGADLVSTEANVFTPTALAISGNLTGSGGLTKSGAGTLTLSGTNTGLTGPLTINSGSINFNSLAALPGDMTGPTSQIVVTGTGGSGQTNAAGLICNTGTTAAPLELARDIRISSGLFNPACAAAGQALKLSGTISGAGGVFIQTPDGSEVWLTGNNTYTGTTFINFSGTSTTGGGVAHIYSDANLGYGGAVDLTTKLVLEGDWTTSRLLNLNATGASSDKTVIDTQGFTATLNGPLTGYSTALAAQVGGTIHKAGAGRMVLSSSCNADAFAQAIAIDAGALIVNTRIGPSAAAITVNTNGTLGGSGSIMRNITVNSGGTLAPGSSPGVLTEYGNLTLSSGSNLATDLYGPGPGVGYDQMAVNGIVSLTGANLNITLGYNPYGHDYFILTNDGAEAVVGTFAGLAEGMTVSLGTLDLGNGPELITAQISYLGNWEAGGLVPGGPNYVAGNDVVLYNVVPAPGAAALLGLGGLLGARRRRR